MLGTALAVKPLAVARDGRADGRDFAQTHLGDGIEKAGIDLEAFAVDGLRA